MEERDKVGRKITQLEIADAVDQDQSTVSKWVRGRMVPGGENLSKLADLFEVSADWLLGRTDRREVTQTQSERKISNKEEMTLREVHKALDAAADAVDALNSTLEDARRSLARTGVELGRADVRERERKSPTDGPNAKKS